MNAVKFITIAVFQGLKTCQLTHSDDDPIRYENRPGDEGAEVERLDPDEIL